MYIHNFVRKYLLLERILLWKTTQNRGSRLEPDLQRLLHFGVWQDLYMEDHYSLIGL